MCPSAVFACERSSGQAIKTPPPDGQSVLFSQPSRSFVSVLVKRLGGCLARAGHVRKSGIA